MSLIERIGKLPGVRAYRRRKYRRRFATQPDHNLFYGAYGAFADAARDAPTNRNVGYDNPEAADMYTRQLSQVWPNHYPLLFWLSRRWPDLRDVLDFGGHRGTLFYSSLRLLGPGPEWYVFDVPAVVRNGRQVAADRDMTHIHFEDDLTVVPEVQVVVASGSLQYVEDTAEQWLARIPGEPEAVLLNETPFHPTREVVTLNNMGTAYCPYQIRRGEEFFDGLEALGYKCVEEWHHPGKQCHIPFHVEPWEITYRGGYFRRS